MTYSMLISTEELALHLQGPDWLVVDCRFVLSRPDEKKEQYLRAHIPGSIYAHLDRDLSSKVIPGETGRHPLPAPEETARRFGQMGIGPETQVLAYDDQGGSLAAVRLWLMLHWLGHKTAAILDGGWQKWLGEDRPVEKGRVTRPAQTFIPTPHPGIFVGAADVERIRLDPDYKLIDVRAHDRYTGEFEPIDPIAGHIPGAINAPYEENLTPSGTFRSPEELARHYRALLGDVPAERVVFYCGSGVTSIHSYLAMLRAGLGESRVYAGSWSEWIANRQRPVAQGSEQT
jgi:thiosulfate/3-mercaptopyruvate sulfurtransferase